jgi:uncharacterized repeat protein (TIGR01451 family)
MICVCNTESNTLTFFKVGTNQFAGEVNVGVAPFALTSLPQSVLNISATAAPTPVEPGQQLTFTLSYSNTGKKTALGAVINATVPANSVFSSATAGGVLAGSSVEWEVGDLEGGDAGQVSFTVSVNSPLPPDTTLISDAIITDADAVTATTMAFATVRSRPLYSLAAVDSPDPVTAGGTLTYTISYANNAGANAVGQGVTIAAIYDSKVTFVSAVPAPAAGTNNQWAIGTLPVGASGTITVTVAVNSPLPSGTILQTQVRLTDSLGGGLNTTSNTPVQSNPLLAVAMADLQDPAPAGGQLTYNITYSNTGTAAAQGIVLRTLLDPRLSFLSATPPPDPGTTDRWSIGTLNVGQTGMIVLTVNVTNFLQNGTILTSQVTMNSSGAASANGSQNTTVSSAPAFNLAIVDSPDPATPGDMLTYTISYANSGSDAATNTTLLLTYGAGTAFASAAPPPNLGNNQWNLGTVPAGGSGTIAVTVATTSGLNSIVPVQAVISDSSGHSASATQNTTFQITPVLTLTVSDAVDPVVPGDLVTYTIRYGNSGNGQATGTVVTANLSPNVAFVSATPAPDAGFNNRWTRGNLDEGVTGEIFVTVRVTTPLANGTILTNQATVTATGGLLATDSESTTVQSTPALAISKVDAVDPTPPGQNLVYTISFSNPGTDSATGVVITEAYDSLTTFVSANPPPDTGTTNRWTIGTVAAGASASINVTVAVPTLPDGTLLTNVVSIQDAAGRSAAATQSTTVDAPTFTIGLTDSADPVSGQVVDLVITYQNVSGTTQNGVVVSAAYDSRFLFDRAIPAPDPGTDNVWTLGTLGSGQSGAITVTGIFDPGQGGATVVPTSVQVSNLSGTASAAETTTVNPLPGLSRQRVRIKQSPGLNDRWKLTARFIGPLDPTDQLLSIAIVTPGPNGEDHITPLVLYDLELSPGGERWRYAGNVAGNGEVRALLRLRSTEWRLRVRARGQGILPGLPADTQFRVEIQVGGNVFMSQTAEFRQSPTGYIRTFP